MLRPIAVPAALLSLAALLVSPLHGQAPASTTPEPELVDTTSDASERMTVPVSIDGRGAYSFVVDTGAERTVISRDLARDLQLGPGGSVWMHSMTERSQVSTVLIPHLELGTRSVKGIRAPALDGRAMGAEGMLGVDSLKSQRVSFDFVKGQMTIVPSRRSEAEWPVGTVSVRARRRLGHLLLADAYVDGERVYAVVDTGSQATIGNSALRRKLERKGKLGPVKPMSLVSVTGGIKAADQVKTGHMWLGGAKIIDLPIAFADVHAFTKLGLTGRPAIMLGMDALKLFDRVSVDFANRRVRLLRPGSSALDEAAKMARRQPDRALHVG